MHKRPWAKLQILTKPAEKNAEIQRRVNALNRGKCANQNKLNLTKPVVKNNYIELLNSVGFVFIVF